MTEITTQIKTRCYWSIQVRPTIYVENKVPRNELLTVVQKSSVRLRGWDFPHVDVSAIGNDDSFISCETHWMGHIEHWRMYESGQFVLIRGNYSDWAEAGSEYARLDDGRELLDVVDVVYSATEIFEFAHRLSLALTGTDQIELIVGLKNIRPRRLYANPAYYAGDFQQYTTTMDEHPESLTLSRDDLALKKDEFAIEFSRNVFERFGWTPQSGVIEQYQKKIRELRSSR